jgi:hypothetical protein
MRERETETKPMAPSVQGAALCELKRPFTVCKRDLFECQKRPITVTMRAVETLSVQAGGDLRRMCSLSIECVLWGRSAQPQPRDA